MGGLKNARASRGQKWQRSPADYVATIVLGLVLCVALLPPVWNLLTSFKPTADIGSYPPKLLFTPTLDHYITALRPVVLDKLLNSILLTVLAVMVSLVAGVPAGYALGRFRSKWYERSGLLFLSARFLPNITFLLPLFLLYREIRLTGTLFGLVIAYQVFLLPLTVWITWGFFAQVPGELEEAAMIDGCGLFRSFWHIMLPLAIPGVTSAAVIATIWAWNEFLVPLVLAGRAMRVLPTGLAQYTGGEQMVAQWGAMGAYATIVMLPVVISALVLQKYLLAGFLRQGRK